MRAPDGPGAGGPEAVQGKASPSVPGAIAVVGPTATGKSALAVAVARLLGGEVISVDSRQAYRGMEVGTAAPTAGEREAVPHHGVAFLEPDERYGAGRFARLARDWVTGIRARGRVPVLAGGTGLFLSALLDPVFRDPEVDEERRSRLRRWMRERPGEELRLWARRLDPDLSRRLVRVDRQRAARTLELALLTGRPVTWWQDHGEAEAPPLRALCYLLVLPSEAHRERIVRRTEALLDRGWPEETRRLVRAGHRDAAALDAVGYGHVLALVRGELGRQEAVARISRDTWAYARRQRTWFRHRLPEGTTRLDAREPTGQLARRIAEEWRAAGGEEPREARGPG